MPGSADEALFKTVVRVGVRAVRASPKRKIVIIILK